MRLSFFQAKVCTWFPKAFVIKWFSKTNVQRGVSCEWQRHPKVSNSYTEWPWI